MTFLILYVRGFYGSSSTLYSYSVGSVALPFLLSSSSLRYSSNFTSDGIK